MIQEVEVKSNTQRLITFGKKEFQDDNGKVVTVDLTFYPKTPLAQDPPSCKIPRPIFKHLYESVPEFRELFTNNILRRVDAGM